MDRLSEQCQQAIVVAAVAAESWLKQASWASDGATAEWCRQMAECQSLFAFELAREGGSLPWSNVA